MVKEAVILAGGLGTRLRSVVKDCPKVLAPVLDKPFLSWVLEFLLDYGIEHVVLSVGYLGEQIRDFYGDSYKNLALSYSSEDSPAGTGGGIKRASRLIKGDKFFTLNGDSISDLPLDKFAQATTEASLSSSIGLAYVEDTQRYGKVELDNNHRITAFGEKSASGPGYINCGIYLFSKSQWDRIQINEPFSVETQVLPILLNDGLYGFAHKGVFIDIGTPESFAAATDFIRNWLAMGNKAIRRDI